MLPQNKNTPLFSGITIALRGPYKEVPGIEPSLLHVKQSLYPLLFLQSPMCFFGLLICFLKRIMPSQQVCWEF